MNQIKIKGKNALKQGLVLKYDYLLINCQNAINDNL